MYTCKNSHAGFLCGNNYYSLGEWLQRLPKDAKLQLTVTTRHGNGRWDVDIPQALPRASVAEAAEAIAQGVEPWAGLKDELVLKAQGFPCWAVYNGIEFEAHSLRLGLTGTIERGWNNV